MLFSQFSAHQKVGWCMAKYSLNFTKLVFLKPLWIFCCYLFDI